MKRAVSTAAAITALALCAAVASGRLPHLLTTQAIVSALMTMLLAPLCLLAVPADSRWRRLVRPFPAIGLLAAGTVAVQLPPVVAVVAGGGVLSLLAMLGLLGAALAFWAVVVPPARIQGLPAAAYVIVGGAFISMPALLLVMAPRDIYAAFHAQNVTGVDPHLDQLLSGFILFGAVKVVIFTAFSVIFFAAGRSEGAAEAADGDGGSRVPRRPTPLPGWVRDIVEGRPLPMVEEPAPPRAAGKR